MSRSALHRDVFIARNIGLGQHIETYEQISTNPNDYDYEDDGRRAKANELPMYYS